MIFITSRLDFCHSLTCLSQKSIKGLRIVQNSAAKLLTGTRRFDHISPVQPHCTGSPSVLGLILRSYLSLHGLAPDYILDLLIPDVPKCNLRTLDRGLLSFPESRLKSRGIQLSLPTSQCSGMSSLWKSG